MTDDRRVEPTEPTEPASPTGPTDRDLVREARASSPGAFAALVARYRRLVAALVARTTGRSDETDDLVQEVFLDAYRGLGSLREPERLKGWLARLALNRARMWGRRAVLERGARARAGQVEAAAAAETPAIERDEERRRLLAAIRELPAETQAVVTLRYLEGRPAPEIAAELGTTPEAVRMRLSRALRALRERLGGEEP